MDYPSQSPSASCSARAASSPMVSTHDPVTWESISICPLGSLSTATLAKPRVTPAHEHDAGITRRFALLGSLTLPSLAPEWNTCEGLTVACGCGGKLATREVGDEAGGFRGGAGA